MRIPSYSSGGQLQDRGVGEDKSKNVTASKSRLCKHIHVGQVRLLQLHSLSQQGSGGRVKSNVIASSGPEE